MLNNPPQLYTICIDVAVSSCKFNKKEFRSLPNNVLFDFYYKLFVEKRLCLLAVEFSELEVFNRVLAVKHQRTKLLRCFQSLIDHGSNVPEDLIQSYFKSTATYDISNARSNSILDTGLRIGGFFNEGGWFNYSIQILNSTKDLCLKQPQNEFILRKLLDCYHKKIYAEAIYCEFIEAENTFRCALDIVSKLEKLKSFPNLAGLYTNFSILFFNRSEYDEGFAWAKKALKILNNDLPTRVVIEVLRQASKSCVVKRRFHQAGLLIRQAVNLAADLYAMDLHPHYSDTLLDYGFYLLNFDSVQASVKVYENALTIRKDIFGKYNIHIALGHEDLAYALYVYEYSSGRFYAARDHAERSIRIMERILPKDHLMLASVKRVKALILEEIALDLREGNHSKLQEEYLQEAEELHKAALALSFTAFGEKNVQTAKHYGNLGRLYQSMKLYEDAEKMHLRAIAIKEELLGTEDYEVGLSIGHLASLYNYHMHRHREAEKLYLRSIEINVNLFGDAYSGLEYDYRGLIHIYVKLVDTYKMTHYANKMREWTSLRNNIKPVAHKEEVYPLKELLDRFFSSC